jgi:hypothetical protein
LPQVPEMLAIGQLPGAGHRNDIPRVLCSSQTQSRIGGTARLSHAHDTACPAWGPTVLHHLPAQAVRRPFDLWGHGGQGQRDPHACPAGQHPHHPQPKVEGAGSPWRVVWPQGGCRPRCSCNVLAPLTSRPLSAGGGSLRRVAVALCVMTAAASHGRDRTRRRGVQEGRCRGREAPSPLRVPCPGARITAINSQQHTRKGCACAQRKGPLARCTAPARPCGGCLCDPTGVVRLCVLGCWLHPAYTGALLFSGGFTTEGSSH